MARAFLQSTGSACSTPFMRNSVVTWRNAAHALGISLCSPCRPSLRTGLPRRSRRRRCVAHGSLSEKNGATRHLGDAVGGDCARVVDPVFFANLFETVVNRETLMQNDLLRTVRHAVLLMLMAVTMPVQAAIPPAERQVLLDLYADTNGDGWTDHTGWNGAPGTECTWFGITCNEDESHVTDIALYLNGLEGSLPSISDLTQLVFFDVGWNQLTGSIPSPAGLHQLKEFRADSNQLTGPIPSLAGLANLQYFYVSDNQLTGSIPSLAGLANLQYFDVSDNHLTGPIPPLAELAELTYFWVAVNQLTGPLPSVSGLQNLEIFDAQTNDLTGPIPPLSDLPALRGYSASGNHLTGSIPVLDALGSLESLYVAYNELTGTVPSLANLTNLKRIRIGGNQLRGDMPTVPNPAALLAASSQLCGNYLNPVPNADWDFATGETPWYQNCTPLPDSIFEDGFDA
jgi:Leucine-rich repeat (LRR) protein